MRIFYPVEYLGPGGRILGGQAPESSLQLLVESLCLAVGLRLTVAGEDRSC